MTIAYNGLKKLNAAIKSIKVNGPKLMDFIHNTAVQAGLHLLQEDPKTGKPCMDARPMDQLLQALPDGVRKEGFKIWVQKYFPIRWNGDNQVSVQKETSKNYTPVNVEGANTEKFWDASKENEVRKLAPEFLRALIEREVKKIISANDQGEITDKDGKVTMILEGNVVEMKDFAKAADDFLKTAPHVSRAVPKVEEKPASVPSAIAAAQKVVVTETEVDAEPIKATGTNG